MRLSVLKKNWEPGKYQALVYIRLPDGSEACTSWDKLPEELGSKICQVVAEICSRKSVRTFWERLLSICSAHQDIDPNCKLCQAMPGDILPGWDDAKAQAEIAGLMKCKHCGFDFYRTSLICVACNKPATNLNLAEAMDLAEGILKGTGEVDHDEWYQVIDSLYFHMRMTLGRIRRIQGKEEDGKTSPR